MERGVDVNLRVGIFIPTMNRADFLIRQLNYYARVGCPHTIYIGDSSRPDEAEKIKSAIQKINGKVRIIFEDHAGLNVIQSTIKLLDRVEEKYTCFNADDDFQVPSSLTKCAEFLENNPDFAAVSGHAVSVRIKNNGVYGEIERIADYPTREFTADSPTKRMIDYFRNYHGSFLCYVHKTEKTRRDWENLEGIKDKSLAGEIVPSVSGIISGKSKKLDCLCFVRQIHDSHYALPNTLDWITSNEWPNSFSKSLEKLSRQLSENDNISLDMAKTFVKEGFWLYMQKQLEMEYYETFPHRITRKTRNKLQEIRLKLAGKFPILKYAYRKWIKPIKTGKRYLHLEITQPYSKYYKDFKPIKDSLMA